MEPLLELPVGLIGGGALDTFLPKEGESAILPFCLAAALTGFPSAFISKRLMAPTFSRACSTSIPAANILLTPSATSWLPTSQVLKSSAEIVCLPPYIGLVPTKTANTVPSFNLLNSFRTIWALSAYWMMPTVPYRPCKRCPIFTGCNPESFCSPMI